MSLFIQHTQCTGKMGSSSEFLPSAPTWRCSSSSLMTSALAAAASASAATSRFACCVCGWEFGSGAAITCLPSSGNALPCKGKPAEKRQGRAAGHPPPLWTAAGWSRCGAAWRRDGGPCARSRGSQRSSGTVPRHQHTRRTPAPPAQQTARKQGIVIQSSMQKSAVSRDGKASLAACRWSSPAPPSFPSRAAAPPAPSWARHAFCARGGASEGATDRAPRNVRFLGCRVSDEAIHVL